MRAHLHGSSTRLCLIARNKEQDYKLPLLVNQREPPFRCVLSFLFSSTYINHVTYFFLIVPTIDIEGNYSKKGNYQLQRCCARPKGRKCHLKNTVPAPFASPLSKTKSLNYQKSFKGAINIQLRIHPPILYTVYISSIHPSFTDSTNSFTHPLLNFLYTILRPLTHP